MSSAPPHLSWTPKPADWPVDFDRSVATDTDYGRCLVVALGGGRFCAILDGQQPTILPQRGNSRSAAHKAVRQYVARQRKESHRA